MKPIFLALLLFSPFACSIENSPDHFILYGTADTSSVNQAVVYITMSGGGYGGACSGTLIAPDVVLTAAHCIAPAANMRVYFGNSTNTFTAQRNVSATHVHPNWDPNFQQTRNLANDIALLRLASPAPSTITPIPYLPAAQALTQGEVGTLSLEFVGFGLTETGSSGTKLRMNQILQNICEGSSWCNISIPNVGVTQVPPNTFGILINTNGGICSGDSGGPAFVVRSGTKYVAGISSFVLTNAQDRCDYYGAATKVDRFTSFIASFLGTAVENCTNGIDDDGDGLVDCADPDCAADPACQANACQEAVTIGCGATIMDSTQGAISMYVNYGNNCTQGHPMNGPEKAYRIVGGTGTRVNARLTLSYSNTDLELLLLKGACNPANCSAASMNQAGQAENLSFTLDGQEHYLIVETYQNPGPYNLQITCENEQPPVEICNNGIDDDGDGKIDCDDPDCVQDPACRPPAEICNNGIDDDGDGKTDCADADCFAESHCLDAVEICDNGIDDDYDGFIDCADADCWLTAHCAHVQVQEICTNGIDDDGDGLIDCEDPLCRSARHCHPGLEICDNGIDDDGDGFTDCDDADCQSFAGCPPRLEICDNGIDDDGDGRIDCDDPKCSSFTPCRLTRPWTKEFPADGCTCRSASGTGRSPVGFLGMFLALVGFAVFRRRVFLPYSADQVH